MPSEEPFRDPWPEYRLLDIQYKTRKWVQSVNHD